MTFEEKYPKQLPLDCAPDAKKKKRYNFASKLLINSANYITDRIDKGILSVSELGEQEAIRRSLDSFRELRKKGDQDDE